MVPAPFRDMWSLKLSAKPYLDENNGDCDTDIDNFLSEIGKLII